MTCSGLSWRPLGRWHGDAPRARWAALGWECRYGPGQAPGVPKHGCRACELGENHERAVLVANEVIERYQPDGIHLDYARYPNADLLARFPCACARCREARLRWLGKPIPDPQDLVKPGVIYKEVQMRAEYVRAFVESMRGLTDYHGVQLSASVRPHYYDDALAEGQDWAEWCADALIGICCNDLHRSSGTFALWMARHRRLKGGAVQWLAGTAWTARKHGWMRSRWRVRRASQERRRRQRGPVQRRAPGQAPGGRARVGGTVAPQSLVEAQPQIEEYCGDGGR